MREMGQAATGMATCGYNPCRSLIGEASAMRERRGMTDSPKKHKPSGSLTGTRAKTLSSGRIGSIILAGVALLCAAVGQPYAAVIFLFISVVFLFGSRPGGDL